MKTVDTVIKRRINFMCQQENNWVGEKAKELNLQVLSFGTPAR